MQTVNFDEPLLDRKSAARFLNIKPNTLAVWDCTKRYDLHPIKIGKTELPERPYDYAQHLNQMLLEEMDNALEKEEQERKEAEKTPFANDNKTIEEQIREQKRQAFREQMQEIQRENERNRGMERDI